MLQDWTYADAAGSLVDDPTPKVRMASFQLRRRRYHDDFVSRNLVVNRVLRSFCPRLLGDDSSVQTEDESTQIGGEKIGPSIYRRLRLLAVPEWLFSAEDPERNSVAIVCRRH